jgi:hypothetical protein
MKRPNLRIHDTEQGAEIQTKSIENFHSRKFPNPWEITLGQNTKSKEQRKNIESCKRKILIYL